MANTDTVEEKFTIQLPDWQDEEAVATFQEQLAEHADVRGVKMLQVRSATVLKHLALVERDIKQAQKAVNYINGVRTTTQSKGDSKRSLRYRATQFYNSLSTTQLRQHCAMYNIDYDSFEDMDSIIAALVEANLAGQNGTGHTE